MPSYFEIHAKTRSSDLDKSRQTHAHTLLHQSDDYLAHHMRARQRCMVKLEQKLPTLTKYTAAHSHTHRYCKK